MRGVVAVVLLALVVLPAAAPAADLTPPTIARAELKDADHDGRADTLVVTFSEPIRHAKDTRKPFPLRVAGYTVASVGAASGKTVRVKLVEKADADYAARPKVSYSRTRSKPVLDRAGNQAKAQRFAKTLAHGRDRDGDGYRSPADCAPDNGAIHPGATDLPDLAFVDRNCDGLDGDAAKAVFVAVAGDDLFPGTQAKPKRHIKAALETAQALGRTAVLVAAGTYSESVSAVSGIGIYGAYDADWHRSAVLAASTLVTGAPQALLADGDTGVRLQLLSLAGVPIGSNNESVYGIRAVNGSSLTLQAVLVSAASAGAGAPGSAGGPGIKGNDGANGADGGAGGTSALGCLGGTSALAISGVGAGSAGGDGLTIPGGGTIGLGGAGGSSGSCSVTSASNGGDAPDAATAGGPGNPGAPGAGGVPDSAATAGAAWVPRFGQDGQLGRPGGGGGAGGGGGGTASATTSPICTNCSSLTGGRGGGGGAGGSGGEDGTGGSGGGGSFGIYLWNSTVSATGGSIAAGNGGDGGSGGAGGVGGDGGLGGMGKGGEFRSNACGARSAGAGAPGKPGGKGGDGGAGGGGAGGPSVGVFRAGTSTFSSSGGTAIKLGTPGAGGMSPAGGASNGAAGPSGAVVPAS